MNGAARGALGLSGEDAAAILLEAEGFRVLGRRVRTLGGELDLVAMDKDTLVFVEVKAARRGWPGSHPAENVHAAKRGRLIRAARAYLAGLSRPCACRFDVVTVQGRAQGRPDLEHFVGAFSL